MRIAAIAGGSAIAGAKTENGNVVGQFTLEGTAFLVIFGGLSSGILGGLLFGLFGSWLPHRTLAKGATFGFLLLTSLGFIVINNENPDFGALGIPLLNVALFAGLFILYGMVIAVAAAPLSRLLQRPGTRMPLPLETTYLVAPLFLMLIPIAFGGMIAGISAFAVGVLAWRFSSLWFPPLQRFVSASPSRVRRAQVLLLVTVGIAGATVLTLSVAGIL